MTQPIKPRGPDSAGGGTEPSHIAEIEAELDQTRNKISGDLRTIGERLSPEHLKEEVKEVMLEAKNVAVETLHEAKDVATSTFREVKDSAVDTVSAKVDELRDNVRLAEREAVSFLRENAVPLALIGVGVAWFVANRRTSERRWNGEYEAHDHGRWRYPAQPGSHALDAARGELSRVADGTRDMASRAKERAEHWVEGAEHKLSDVAGRVRGFAEREVDHAREVAHDAEHKLGRAAVKARDLAARELDGARELARHATEDHPLAVGAAAVAAGVCVGLLLPSTRREREMLGPQRDRWVGEAKGAVQDWTHTAKEAARNVKTSLAGSAG